MYTKQQILANPNIVIHCENEQEWEECKQEFPNITSYKFLYEEYNCMRPGGGYGSIATVGWYKRESKYTIITYKDYKTFNVNLKFITPFPKNWEINGSEEFKQFIHERKWDQHVMGNMQYQIYRFSNEEQNIRTSTYRNNGKPYVKVTMEQLIKHYTPNQQKETNMTHTISKKQLKEIHDVACYDWKSKIKAYASEDPFSDIIAFTEAEVKAMFDTATPEQRVVLRSIFVDYGKNKSIDNLKSDLKYFQADGGTDESLIALEKNSINNNRFWLNSGFTWTLEGNFLKCSVRNN